MPDNSTTYPFRISPYHFDLLDKIAGEMQKDNSPSGDIFELAYGDMEAMRSYALAILIGNAWREIEEHRHG